MPGFIGGCLEIALAIVHPETSTQKRKGTQRNAKKNKLDTGQWSDLTFRRICSTLAIDEG